MLSCSLFVALAAAASPAAAADSAVLPEAGATHAPAPSDSGPVVILETVRGRIVLQLDEQTAPRTAGNFLRLVRQGFYDGTYFHVAFPGFKIQGGDPNTKNADPRDDGLGGPGYTLAPEIELPCVRGALVAARLPDEANPGRESSGSQFFILLSDQPALDRAGYTVFGHVIRGLDVAESIGRLGGRAEVLAGRGGPDPEKRALLGRAYVVDPASAGGAGGLPAAP